MVEGDFIVVKKRKTARNAFTSGPVLINIITVKYYSKLYSPFQNVYI